MKKLMIIATAVSCVIATAAIADINSYCPNPQAIKKVGGQFIGYAPMFCPNCN